MGSLSMANVTKGLIAAATVAVATLQPYYGGQHWFIALVAGLGALGVTLSESHTAEQVSTAPVKTG